METKKNKRNRVLEDLMMLPDVARAHADEAIAHHLGTLSQTGSQRLNIGLYYGVKHEMRTGAIDAALARNGISRYYPKVEGPKLRFFEIPANLASKDMIPGLYGILEPKPLWPERTAEELDLILVPAVSVTLNGERLGQGGGFYDRVLSQIRQDSPAPPPAVALVMDEQIEPSLPTQPHDQRLDGILSPSIKKWVREDISFYRQEIINLLPDRE